ncbi:Glutamate synthase [NADPH] small chain [uncultured Clostridium sp.]|uniref:Glutamate synthase subunit beta n=1 Tax=Muricoprocola aceti TaxID=2981772 RepID=A0ABT2SQ59_9FIRM|nr:glutamate synthase subunit beta [Muricoprocola aceti]MCU6726183.1 glutamate synthase subunit beta [Muricoprocola aceti]SCH80300.1 Glutamate synthase [NADPH] small chain [uncultured Clostridium sp.]
MGKPTGFMEYERETAKAESPLERIHHFNEFHTPLSKEKQRQQAARCMACGVPFCQAGMMIGGMASGCPLNNLVPEWNDLLYNGCYEQAYARLMKTHCFPEFTSRVCPALCEKACTCNLNGDPVSTKENERTIIENAFATGLVKANPPKVRTGKTVAVVGSGPSGLATAMQLNKRGHKVTVFERNDRIGGLLRYGIPNMKLEKQVIDRRVKLMEEEGIEFVTNANIGVDITAEELLQKYDRVVLCCGASNPRDINAPGRDAKGIYFAVDFLKATTKSLLDSNFEDHKYIDCKGKTVMVIGGGDTGNDCVGTSIRLGAKNVIQLEMMPKAPDERAANNPWPQWPRVCKTDYGQEEAIAKFGHDPRIYTTTVSEFIKNKNGELVQAKLVKLQSKKDEKSGRMMMVPIEGSEEIINVDIVLIAAGFLGSQKYVTDAFKVNINGRTNVDTAPGKYQTSVPNVFTAGDMHRGQSLVVWAIREGREAAKAVDESLMGYTNL